MLNSSYKLQEVLQFSMSPYHFLKKSAIFLQWIIRILAGLQTSNAMFDELAESCLKRL